VDVVSSSTGDYPEKILPVLPYTDYLIINEVEICNAWGENPRHADGTIDVDTICRVMKKTIARGVKEKVVIHAKEAGFCLSADGTFTKMGSLRIPAEMIAGSVGAGDAYCAGCLYAIYNGYTDEEMLKFASAAAACNLFAENSVDGMRSKKEIYKLMERYGRYPI
jgi:sugar/nucleoside kinase (ribokinase family)